MLGPHLLLAHGVWLDDEEIELVLSSRTAIAYCPWAYLRLGQGVTRVGRHADIVERGGRVALGCDAANAGDVADILRAAALAAGIARDGRLDPNASAPTRRSSWRRSPAPRRSAWPTGSARSRPASRPTSSSTDADGWGWSPRGDVGLQLVWGTDGRSVRDVFVAGRRGDPRRTCVTVDTDALWRESDAMQQSLLDGPASSSRTAGRRSTRAETDP